MKPLIQHYLRENSEQVLKRSLKNCHCKGVHSIMLSEAPEKTIRLYIATAEHELSKRKSLSVGIHPHHCNITLHVIKGTIINQEYVETESSNQYAQCFQKYWYQSIISTGELAFKLQEEGCYLVESNRGEEYLYNGLSAYLPAQQLHTVFIRPGITAAWLVYEGKEDPGYCPWLYTNTDPNKAMPADMYQKFTSLDEIEDLINSII